IADSFELAGKKLGRLELQAVNAMSIFNPAGFASGSGSGAANSAAARSERQLKKLNLSNPDGTLDATGIWGPEISLSTAPNAQARQRTKLSFTINVANVGKLMDRLGLKDTVRNGTALLEGEAMWRGSPISIDYA